MEVVSGAERVLPPRRDAGPVRAMDDIRQGRCPLCRNHVILESRPLTTFVTEGQLRLSPVLFARGKDERRGLRSALLGGRAPIPPAATMLAYSCMACGYSQIFAEGLSEVPIGEAHGTRLIVGAKSEEPFR